ncbi:hypothetical protein KR018_007374, partial [Drosophila ironensis]
SQTKKQPNAGILSAEMMVAARPKFDEFLRYAKVELTPPLPADFQKLKKTAELTAKSSKKGGDCNEGGGKKSGLGEMKVADAWLNFLVGVEVVSWFFMGEVIGRRHLVGYKV